LAATFSRGIDRSIRQGLMALGLIVSLSVAGFYYYAYPQYTRVGFAPDQPVPFSHQLHVGQLGMDCRYCHTHVEQSPHASVPASETCMNCHNPQKANVKGNSPLLAPVRESYLSGKPVEWKRIHQLPHYAFFNHSIHIARGVSCVSCHGQINEMKVVYHDQPLSMGWCLDCHYHPGEAVRPRDQVTNLLWKPDGKKSKSEIGLELIKKDGIQPPDNCGACHR
jgi:cytochrome c553